MQISTMKAIVTSGTGGYDKLEYLDVPIPTISDGEVLIKVLAAGINNTDINTRLGWYAASNTGATDSVENAEDKTDDGGWDGATPFPLIQGVDCCGIVVEGKEELIGKRVLIRSSQRKTANDKYDHQWIGVNYDGAFAQYVKSPIGEVFPIDSSWSDAELASLPCAYGTSENMLHRSAVLSGERILITGASGGVGSASIQLAKRRGSFVIAVASKNKHEQMACLGADILLDRNDDLVSILGECSVDVVVDNVAGPGFPDLLLLLKRGGRYISCGAIAGPIVDFDIRNMYLKDLTLFGSTAWEDGIFENLISYVEQNEIKPFIAKTYPLADIVAAQKDFLTKKHAGKFVLIPPAT